ncbi:flagellin N-terminal helical domain-containing protein [Teichococcus aestuarii]|uniref:flagellin N-terminal helical domain-containing protein n=1 Tax=Teichococcus aestuarii TaxID=568898 RepID=UPI00361D1563
MQSLRSLNKQVSTVQIQIATGKRVNTAKDDAAIWSLANTLKTDRPWARKWPRVSALLPQLLPQPRPAQRRWSTCCRRCRQS